MEKNSEIILCNLKGIDKDGKNVLDYISSRFLTLCRNNATATRTKYSIIDPEKSVSVNIPYGVCLTSNYIAFYNPSYSNKWWFAFIDDVIYKSDNCCEIIFTIDAWHTWFDEFEASPVMVAREHTNNDTIGRNIEPEPIDIGELVAHYSEKDINISTRDGYYVIFACTYDITNLDKFAGVTVFDGYLSSVKYYAFPLRHANWENDANTINEFITQIEVLVLRGAGVDTISSVFLYPYGFFTGDDISGNTLVNTDPYPIIQENRPALQERSYSLNLYRNYSSTIKNKKLFTYPFCFMRVDNNNGASVDLKYEHFNNSGYGNVNTPVLKVDGVFTVNGSYKIIPVNYKGQNKNIENSIPLAKFPVVSFTGDSFREWLFGNAHNVAINNAGAGWLGVANTLMTGFNAFITSNAPTGNTSTGDGSFINSDVSFKTIGYRPADEKIAIIDNFFTRYGYATNRLKVPNITGRTNFNYVQVSPDSVTCNSAIPSKYKDKINQMFRNGVTIWHYYIIIGNYNTDNGVTASATEN